MRTMLMALLAVAFMECAVVAAAADPSPAPEAAVMAEPAPPPPPAEPLQEPISPVEPVPDASTPEPAAPAAEAIPEPVPPATDAAALAEVIEKKQAVPPAYPKVAVGGLLQVRNDTKVAGAGPDTNQFWFGRIRLHATGHFSEKIQGHVQLRMDKLDDHPRLYYAHLRYAIHPLLVVQAGQFARPFSLEHATGTSGVLALADKSAGVGHATRQGYVEADLGLQLSGEWNFWGDMSAGYAIGLFNGDGMIDEAIGLSGGLDSNPAKDYVGRLTFTPIRGLTFGGSYYWKNYGGFSADNGTPGDDSDDWRVDKVHFMAFAADIRYLSDSINLMAAWMYGDNVAPEIANGLAPASRFINATLLVAYHLPLGLTWLEALEPAIRFDYHDPDTSADRDAAYHGNLSLAALFNRQLKLMLNYTAAIPQDSDTQRVDHHLKAMGEFEF